MGVPKMANREVCNVLFCEYKTKKPFLNMDYANVSTAEMTGESVYAYGGWGHPKRVTFFGERGGTISFETQITPFDLYSLMTGGDIESGANWLKREVVAATEAGKLTVTSKTATTATVFKADDDCGTAISGTLSNGTFTAGETSGIAIGDKCVVYYMEELTSAQKISIKSTTFPKYFTAYMETKDKTEAGEDVWLRMIAWKCAPQTDFTLEMSNNGDPASVTITCDLMVDTENDNNILDMIMLDENE
jgi:hypothetical protein